MSRKVIAGPVPVGRPYVRRGVPTVLARFTVEEVRPIVSRDSGAVIGWLRRVDWYVRDVPLDSLRARSSSHESEPEQRNF